MNDSKTIIEKQALLALGLVDFTLVNTLVSDFDSNSTEGTVHTSIKESTDADAVKAFSTCSLLNDMTLVEVSYKQAVKVENDQLIGNNIYVTATYVDEDGVEYPGTQSIELKYSAASKYDAPEFSEFK